jgi:hypothetical protein
VRVEDVSQGATAQRESPEHRRAAGIREGENGGERDGAGAVTGGEAFAIIRVLPGETGEIAGIFPTGADATAQALGEHRQQRCAADAERDCDDQAPALTIETPRQQHGRRRADKLPILRQPARFAFDVAFEMQIKRGGQAELFQDQQRGAGEQEDGEQNVIHEVARE